MGSDVNCVFLEDLVFASQKKCLDFVVEQRDSLDAVNRMNMIYSQVSSSLGSGKILAGTGGYKVFMESKWSLTYIALLESYGLRPDFF